MVEAGMTPLQAIESATANGPDTLGPQAPKSGQLARGLRRRRDLCQRRPKLRRHRARQPRQRDARLQGRGRGTRSPPSYLVRVLDQTRLSPSAGVRVRRA